MRKLLFLIAILPVIITAKAQEGIPINPVTKLVSISNVIELNGKTVQALKQTAANFITKNSVSSPLIYNFNVEKNKVPFFGIKISEFDSSASYAAMFVVAYDKTKSENQDQKADFIDFKINFYFKANKIKYDITSFTHKSNDVREEFRGGAFENEKPETNPSKKNIEKWNKLKINTLSVIKLIAKDIEGYFRSTEKNEADF